VRAGAASCRGSAAAACCRDSAGYRGRHRAPDGHHAGHREPDGRRPAAADDRRRAGGHAALPGPRKYRRRHRTGCCRAAACADRAWEPASSAAPQRRRSARRWRRAAAAADEPAGPAGQVRPVPAAQARRLLPPGPPPVPAGRAGTDHRAGRAWGRAGNRVPPGPTAAVDGPPERLRPAPRGPALPVPRWPAAGPGRRWAPVPVRPAAGPRTHGHHRNGSSGRCRCHRPAWGRSPATCGRRAPPLWRTPISRTRQDP
jgi:hypothetical protein